jgi:hypothetical protein
MKNYWFKKWGWIYRPISFVGWIFCLVVFTLVIGVFATVDRNSHSVSDTLIGVLPWVWIFLATLVWIASQTSDSADHARFR